MLTVRAAHLRASFCCKQILDVQAVYRFQNARSPGSNRAGIDSVLSTEQLI